VVGVADVLLLRAAKPVDKPLFYSKRDEENGKDLSGHGEEVDRHGVLALGGQRDQQQPDRAESDADQH